MTDNEIRIAIAEYFLLGKTAKLPDYPNDLNSMHEAEKLLDPFIPENTDDLSKSWNDLRSGRGMED